MSRRPTINQVALYGAGLCLAVGYALAYWLTNGFPF